MYYPHSLYGSLGSIRRVIEIGKKLRELLSAEVIVYSPYMKLATHRQGLLIKPITSSSVLSPIRELEYQLGKTIYYHRFLSSALIPLLLSAYLRSLLNPLIKTLKEDRISALQIELDIAIPLGLEVKKRLGIPVVADVHNISAEELVSAGVVNRGERSYRYLQDLLRDSLGEVDTICVVSEYMAKYMKREYDQQNVVLVPPAGSLARHPMPSSDNADKSKVVYAGTVSYREHVDLFVDSIVHVTRILPHVEFYITKKGEDLERVRARASRAGADIRWFWHASERELESLLASSSIGVLTSKNDEARRLGTPIKLFDYMSANLPIIANDIGSWSKIIETERVGTLVKDNPEDFASGLIDLLLDEEERTMMSHNAMDAVRRKYNWDKSVEPLVREYRTLL